MDREKFLLGRLKEKGVMDPKQVKRIMVALGPLLIALLMSGLSPEEDHIVLDLAKDINQLEIDRLRKVAQHRNN